ncbi:ComEA family DNA-binding protein [Bizionia sp. KMM 8389]
MLLKKSHFTFTKKQRNGIFLLLSILFLMQFAFYIYNKKQEVEKSSEAMPAAFQQQIDSLKLVEIENRKPKIFPFNPNYISDYKGYRLGMSTEEIDRLHKFRASNNWVNSSKEFQQVTKVSDSLLNSISPFFKFPEWVTNPKKVSNYSTNYNNKPKSYSGKIDLNQATAAQLKQVYGVGDKLSQRIVAYRTKLGGRFIADVQLTEVYGLSPEVIVRIQEQFTVKTPKEVTQVDLNTATKEDLVRIQYIDYEIAHNIIEERTLRDGFKSLDDLKKVKDFPLNKIDIITLYLTLK